MEISINDKLKLEKELVEEIKEVGLDKHYEMGEGNNTYHKFILSDGSVTYWTNMSDENLKELGLGE